jgi:hypothetical protein
MTSQLPVLAFTPCMETDLTHGLFGASIELPNLLIFIAHIHAIPTSS